MFSSFKIPSVPTKAIKKPFENTQTNRTAQTSAMETKRPGAIASAVGLKQTDRQISSLFLDHLPSMPHIFSVASDNPMNCGNPYESRNIPFNRREAPRMQYMTLISNGDRGVGTSEGASHWEEDVYGFSPVSANGSTSTPTSVRDPKKPATKISFGDYKNFKQTGVKPSPKPVTATPEQKPKDGPGHSRSTSNISAITPMGRVLSSDGEGKPATAKVNSIEKAPAGGERTAVPHLAQSNSKHADKGRPITNGTSHEAPSSSKERPASSKPGDKNLPKPPMQHALPPRPNSPPRSNPEHKKRSLESGETHPEKRIKIGQTDSRTPLSSQKASAAKSETHSDSKSSAHSSQKSSSQAKATVPPNSLKIKSSKPIENKAHTSKSSTSNSNKPLDLPPLLSPLPADLGPRPDRHPSSKKSHSDKTTPPKTPAEKGVAPDTIVVKQPQRKSDTRTTHKPRSTSPPPFILPALLSPTLPQLVEEKLLQMNQKATRPDTVEARHERARRPDALGVARKTVKPPKRGAIVGHPPKQPKKDKPESSKLQTFSENVDNDKFVVKIPYKRKHRKDVERILQLTQKPRAAASPVVKAPIPRQESPSAEPRLKSLISSDDDSPKPRASTVSKKRSSDSSAEPARKRPRSSDDDTLSAKASAAAPAASTTSKKRRSDASDESAPKRSKRPGHLETARPSTPVTPAFKSPALTGPASHKSLLATPKKMEVPKKGDAMKGVAMRRVESSESQARTPQANSTSTPASAEKPRSNGVESRHKAELDRQHAIQTKFYTSGTSLKRRGLAQGSPKDCDPKDVTDAQRKTGLCMCVESVLAYMIAFHARDRIQQLNKQPVNTQSWSELLKIVQSYEYQSRPYEELHAMFDQLTAVVLELLGQNHLDAMPDSGVPDGSVHTLRENSRAKQAAWQRVARNNRVLDMLERRFIGPWSTVDEVVDYYRKLLRGYRDRQHHIADTAHTRRQDTFFWSPDKTFISTLEDFGFKEKDTETMRFERRS